MTPEHFDKIYRRAISLGADPLRDPVASHLASRASMLALVCEFGCVLFIAGLAKGKTMAIMLGLALLLIGGIPLLLTTSEISNYSKTSFVVLLTVAILFAPISGLTAIPYFLGMLKR